MKQEFKTSENNKKFVRRDIHEVIKTSVKSSMMMALHEKWLHDDERLSTC